MLKKIKKFSSLVRISHLVITAPFAILGYFIGTLEVGFNWLTFLEVCLCVLFARNAAMSFNRWADREFDKANPRTAQRDIPQGRVSTKEAIWFTVINSALFIVTTYFINRLCFYLSPVALVMLLGYSLTKRTMWLSNAALGVALAIGPVGGYIAVTGKLGLVILLLGAITLFWSLGFEIIYAMQDREFDLKTGLHSIPTRFGVRKSLVISALSHAIAIYGVYIVGLLASCGVVYWIGAGVFTLLIVAQHFMVTPSNQGRLNQAFWLNQIASMVFCSLWIADILLK